MARLFSQSTKTFALTEPTPSSRPPPSQGLCSTASGAVHGPRVSSRWAFGVFPRRHVQGARAVAGQALFWERQADLTLRRALVNGIPGVVAIRDGRPFSVGAFTVKDGKIVEIDFLADPERIAQLDLAALGD